MVVLSNQVLLTTVYLHCIAFHHGVSAPRHIFVALQDYAPLNAPEWIHMIFNKLGVSEVVFLKKKINKK